ncbi:MAG: dihydrolipoamide acetyltransferase family protein [Gammaproteobacteria bacterium]|nr:dihydrolipoamide acetyltransferase family protein [Gammaproteobacteria bacterium]MDE0414654.1 dihydrolipoamide acetyltransferase family protein [Gammaproteobacteria bacterium]MDE0454273.1 dihydrolipoamide acetyltransferase family protein [Gammaproteobacteria bacterium]
MREFKLPDLGEGLTEAEIVEWHVAANDEIKLNQPLVSVETDKAVVEVPSPVTGRVISVHGEAGDVIPVGDVLARFDVPGGDAPSSEDASSSPAKEDAPASGADGKDEAPGVVGELPASAMVMSDTTGSAAAARGKQRVKAAPSVRALARELGVDLTLIEGSGPGGRITARDVAGAAEAARDATPSSPAPTASRAQTGDAGPTPASATEEKLTGPRRAMFHSMTASHSEVALCTVMDDADIHDWESPRDFTPRLIRAMVAGARAEPRLNGTFSAGTGMLSMSEDVHMGLAMETPHGLIVATIFNAGKLSLDELRGEVARLKKAGAERTLKPGEVRGYTITLSNIAGGSSRYATPLMVPPTVGILGSGAAREEVVAVNGEIAIRRVLPLSLTFDHRCVAGADASRFLGAVVADLKLAS